MSLCVFRALQTLKIQSPQYDRGRIRNRPDWAGTRQSFDSWLARLKETFGLDALRIVSYDQADLERVIERVAICGGSGQSFYKDALAKGSRGLYHRRYLLSHGSGHAERWALSLGPRSPYLGSSLCVVEKLQSVEGIDGSLGRLSGWQSKPAPIPYHI